MNYGTGWHWSPIDDDRSMLVPLSTQYATPPLRWRHAETCPVDRVSGLGCTCIVELNDWHPDCGGDWVLSGPNYFANYWPDNTVVASILDGPDGNELATSGIQPFASKAQCMAYAEWWIRAELTAMQTGKTQRTKDAE